MTRDAKSLTRGANSGSHVATPAGTEPASNVRVQLDALGRLGFDVEPLIRAAGVSRADVDDPDGRISCAAIGRILGEAMRVRPLANLGMRMAEQTPIGAYPLLDYLVLTSSTVGQGLEQLARYLRLVASSVVMRFRDAEDPICVVFEGPPGSLQYEFGITLALLHLREETEGRMRPEYVSLAYTPDDPTGLERLLGCPVRAGASWNGWAMSREAGSLPLRRRDPILRGVLQHHANEMLRRAPVAAGVSHDVRRALAPRVAGGDTRVEAVARELAMSVRSLQRRLSEEGCSYQSLVDAIRKEAAEQYLSDSSLSAGEIAYLLGYSEAAAFSRAFKRWSGMTPQGFRHRRGAVTARRPPAASPRFSAGR